MKEKLMKMLGFLGNNLIAVVYGVLAIVLEVGSLVFFDLNPIITKPILPLMLLLFGITLVTLCPKKWMRCALSTLFLLVQLGIILGCDFLFLSNGTVFEWSMFYQRNDAYATVEHLVLNYGLASLCAGIFIPYQVFLVLYMRRCRKLDDMTCHIKNRIPLVTALCAFGIIIVLYRPSDQFGNSGDQYHSLLYDANNNYQEFGLTANLAYEVIHRSPAVQVDTSSLENFNDALFTTRCATSTFNGISAGNNLIMILGESVEWYPLTIYDKDLTEQMYPNLTKFLSNSVACTNFYSREKTDTAEALMLLGSNPTGKYVHNDFGENSYPYSLPALFAHSYKEHGESVILRSFHQSDGEFYNRKVFHKSLGFESLTDIYDMEAKGLENTWETEQHERTSDSKTIELMKDEMFPANDPFFTFWISFSSHGFYDERTTLTDYYALFDSLGTFPEGDQYENYLRTYAATICDLDKAIGIMMDDLEEKGLLETTTILFIADHNSYYSSLSNYVKGIDTQYNSELYRIPFLLYDQKLASAYDEVHKTDVPVTYANLPWCKRAVTKFTTTSDVVPTVLDLFGIDGWENLYFGSTIFGDEESVIFSRAYNILLTDQYMGYSLSDIKFRAEGTTDADFADFRSRAERHMQRLSITDKIFYSDYFSDHDYQY